MVRCHLIPPHSSNVCAVRWPLESATCEGGCVEALPWGGGPHNADEVRCASAELPRDGKKGSQRGVGGGTEV